MCGIAGILTFEPADAAAIARRTAQMTAALEHRGPDGRGVWSGSTKAGHAIALGHTRLAVIDLSDEGAQPMSRQDSVVTFNGEIYNYRELRARLKDAGDVFTTASDTEVLLAAHRHWGEESLDRLDGMFGFGLWDGQADALLLARDRFGVKPLYYYRDARGLVFASEIRALLASGLVPATLDEDAVWHYVGYQTTPTPSTLIRDVRMLEPGSVMRIAADGRCSTRTYWDLLRAASGETVPDTARTAVARIGGLLEDSVKAHLVSDVPVGLFLSSGIDSGSLLSVLSSAGVRPRTFTVSLDDAAADESGPAAQMARHFGADHSQVRVRGQDVLEQLPGIVAALDHPSGDAINSFVVSQAVRNHGLKVALSGLGGDEIFGGYASFRRLARLAKPASALTHAPKAMRRAVASVLRAAGVGAVASEKAAAVLDGEGSVAEIWPVTRQLFSAEARRRMLSDRIPAGRDAYAGMLAAAFERNPTDQVYARVSYAESRAYMHDVLLRDVDQMSMAHALEVRVPLLDHRLASYVVALPDRWKVNGRGQKPLLTRSLKRPLPQEIARAPKRGFALPFETWLGGPLRPFCERHLGERGLDGRGLFKPGEARRLWTRYLDRAPGVTWSRVWTLVAFNAWLEHHSL